MSIRSLVLAVLCVIAFPAAAHAAVPNSRDGEVKLMCRAINTFRAQNGIAPMKMSSPLVSAATWMSNDMAAKNYFNHTDSLGRAWNTRIGAFAYSASAMGENIAAGAADAASTINQWKNSAPHRAAMLNPSYLAMGVGRGYNASSAYGSYWVADFGSSLDRVSDC
jgi:uncharacterized protein YkwD